MKFGVRGVRDELSGSADLTNFRIQKDGHVGVVAFGLEHAENVAGGAVAEKLAESFLVVGDAVLFDEGDEIGGSVAGQCGFGEVRVGGEKVFRLAVKVGEVAASAAGDQNFISQAVGMFEHGDAASALAGFDGTAGRRAAARMMASKEWIMFDT